MLILHPTKFDFSTLDPKSRQIMKKTVAFFEGKGLAKVKHDDHERVWYDDFLTFIKQEKIFYKLGPKAQPRMDESVKRLAYMQIPGLQEYVIVEQGFVKVEVMRRCENWHSCVYFLGDSVELVSVGLRVAVADIYDGVDNADVGAWVERMGDR